MKRSGHIGDVIAKPDKYLDEVVWIPTVEMLDTANPENPRVHEEEGDVAEIFKSLLAFGWGDYGVTFNPHTKLQTGGHGRVQAARLGMQHDEDWFDQAWETWIQGPKERKEVAGFHKERYSPEYWQSVPVIMTSLIKVDQQALMIRLNNTDRDGRDDHGRMAAVLAQLPKQNVELAGWDNTSKKAFTEAFLVKAQEIEEEPDDDEDDDGEGGYDYDAGSPPTNETEREYGESGSGGGKVDYGDDDDDPFATAEDESGPVTTPNGDTLSTANVSTDDIGNVQAEGVNYDTLIREARQILLMTEDQVLHFKALFGKGTSHGPIPFVLEKIGIPLDTNRSIKEWRPDAVIAVLDWFLEQNKIHAQAWQMAQQPKEEAAEEDTDDEDN